MLKALGTTRVPIKASLAEVEPQDPKMNHEWRQMSFSFELRSPTHRLIRVGLLNLVGSKDVPGTDVELKTGEWIELRGKARMEWSNPPAGVLPPKVEKSVIPYPLQQTQHFVAVALGNRGEGYRFDAKKKLETRVCYPGEHTHGGATVDLTIHPKKAS